jgi:hypothetical protein
MAAGKNLRLGFPGVMNSTGGTMSFTSMTLDASNDAAEWVFQAREAATITKLGFRLTSKTGTSPNYKISLQGVNTSGNPDGTIKGGGSPASVVFTFTSITAGDWTWLTLDNAYTCTRGEFLAIVIIYDSGTIDGSNFMSVTISHDAWGGRRSFPIAIANTAGSRSRNSLVPVWGYQSASRTFGEPLKAIAETQFSSDTAGADEYALTFTLPAGFGATKEIGGVRLNGRTSAAGKTLRVILYSGTTALQTVDFDTDNFASTASGFRSMEFIFDEATLETLTVGSQYHLAFQPQDTGHNFALTHIEVSAASDLDAYPGGADFYMSTRVDAGAWTAVDTKRPVAEFLLNDFTEPAGGGGTGIAVLTGGGLAR